MNFVADLGRVNFSHKKSRQQTCNWLESFSNASDRNWHELMRHARTQSAVRHPLAGNPVWLHLRTHAGETFAHLCLQLDDLRTRCDAKEYHTLWSREDAQARQRTF